MMEATSQAEEQPLSLLELPWPAMQSVMHSLGPSGALRLGWVCRNLQKHVSCMMSPPGIDPDGYLTASPAAAK